MINNRIKKRGRKHLPLSYLTRVGFHSLANLTGMIRESSTDIAMEERSKTLSLEKLGCELLRNPMIDIGGAGLKSDRELVVEIICRTDCAAVLHRYLLLCVIRIAQERSESIAFEIEIDFNIQRNRNNTIKIPGIFIPTTDIIIVGFWIIVADCHDQVIFAGLRTQPGIQILDLVIVFNVPLDMLPVIQSTLCVGILPLAITKPSSLLFLGQCVNKVLLESNPNIATNTHDYLRC